MGCYYENVAGFEDLMEIKIALRYPACSIFAAYMIEEVLVLL